MGSLVRCCKSVVKHMELEAFEGTDGLLRFLEVLRSSPLQQLPIPDSFSRMGRWSGMRRRDKESITERPWCRVCWSRGSLNAWARSSTNSVKVASGCCDGMSSWWARFCSISCSKSGCISQCSHGFLRRWDERLYRLLRACRLSSQERQNFLVQTSYSTHFVAIRRALRTLFSDDPERTQPSHPGRIWWSMDDEWNEDDWEQWYQHDAYCYGGSSPGSYNDYDILRWLVWWTMGRAIRWWGEWGNLSRWQSNCAEENQLHKTYALANEAARTLQEAQDAVKKVRQARASVAGRGRGKSKKGFGPCFIGGKPGHSYAQCPDRFSKGKSKGKSFAKGKFGKSHKGKGQSY